MKNKYLENIKKTLSADWEVEKLGFEKNAFKVLKLNFIGTIIRAVNLLYQGCIFTSTERTYIPEQCKENFETLLKHIIGPIYNRIKKFIVK